MVFTGMFLARKVQLFFIYLKFCQERWFKNPHAALLRGETFFSIENTLQLPLCPCKITHHTSGIIFTKCAKTAPPNAKDASAFSTPLVAKAAGALKNWRFRRFQKSGIWNTSQKHLHQQNLRNIFNKQIYCCFTTFFGLKMFLEYIFFQSFCPVKNFRKMKIR